MVRVACDQTEKANSRDELHLVYDGSKMHKVKRLTTNWLDTTSTVS